MAGEMGEGHSINATPGTTAVVALSLVRSRMHHKIDLKDKRRLSFLCSGGTDDVSHNYSSCT